MQQSIVGVALLGQLLLAAPWVGAQDYRARVQGSVVDSTQGALPGATVTMVNDATGVAVTFVADKDGHYIFDFVDPGVYTITGELQGFKKAQQRNVRVPQRGSVTADLMLEVGGLEERVVVEAPPVAVQFKTSSSDLTLERQLVDQVPISGRNPYGLANLDPTINVTLSNENRPYHQPTPTTTTPAAGRGAPTTCCSTAWRSAPATRRPTRRPSTRSTRSRFRRTASTPRTGTAWAASSA
jgi:hypothetical protein